MNTSSIWCLTHTYSEHRYVHLLTNINTMLYDKRLKSNTDVILLTKAYFGVLDKSFNKKQFD